MWKADGEWNAWGATPGATVGSAVSTRWESTFSVGPTLARRPHGGGQGVCGGGVQGVAQEGVDVPQDRGWIPRPSLLPLGRRFRGGGGGGGPLGEDLVGADEPLGAGPIRMSDTLLTKQMPH